MNRIIVYFLLFNLFVSSVGALCISDKQTFNNYDNLIISIPIESYKITEDEGFNKILIDDFGRLSNPGEPQLPSKIFSIAIPPNAKFFDLSYSFGDVKTLEENYIISPVPKFQITISNDINENEINNQKFQDTYNRIYTCDNPYPSKIVEFIQTSGYRNYNLVDIRVTPFTYKPLSGELSFYSDITLNIYYEVIDKVSTSVSTNNIKTENIAKSIVLNYDQAKKWYPTNDYITKGTNDYVIVTLESLVSAVTPLVEWETEKGRTVNVVTTLWIDSNYNGIDLAEKIRNFLRDKYPIEQWGIEDVLLVGHRDDLPMRRTSQKLGNSNAVETDFYYAELSKPDNESWDADGDSNYGERQDSIDFYGEINVGRIPWSDFDTVQHICEKSVLYEQNTDPSYKKNILLLAAFCDSETDGATFMEYKVNSTIHPWMASWSKTRMYERDSDYFHDYVLNHLNVVSVWSQGKYGFVSWHAHGSPEGSYVGNQAFIHINDCSELNDEYPAIISAASCSNSDTDYLNIGQAMMKQGAVGFLGANKAAYYSSGWKDPNDGSDQSVKYFFTKAVTSRLYTQGAALQYAISEMYVRGLWFDLYYETFCHGSLWGNPDLGVISPYENIPPGKPEIPDGPSSGKIRTDYTYSTLSDDQNGDDIYFLFDWGDGTNSGWIGPFNSGETGSASHSWSSEGSFSIKVIASDIHGSESEWSDPLHISMPKQKHIDNIIFRFLEKHSFLYSIIDLLSSK